MSDLSDSLSQNLLGECFPLIDMLFEVVGCDEIHLGSQQTFVGEKLPRTVQLLSPLDDLVLVDLLVYVLLRVRVHNFVPVALVFLRIFCD